MNRVAFLKLAAALPVLPAAMRFSAPRVLVLGDSVMWGQGLEPNQKIHALLARMLYQQNGVEPNILHYAHSGATIGFDEHGNVSHPVTVPNWWPREIPRPNPTIYEQCAHVEADHPDQRFDVVMLTGGINDVGVNTIFDPRTPEDIVRSRTVAVCGDTMSRLLAELHSRYVAANPAVRILVLGYYSVLSHQSDVPNIFKVIEVLAKETIAPPTPVNALQAQAFFEERWSVQDALIRNSEAFAEASRTQLQNAVTVANASAPLQNFEFLDPAITDKEAAFTPDALIWGLDQNEKPEDPVYSDRLEYCDYLLREPRGTALFVCDRASMGHPNSKGAQRYAETAFSYLSAPERVPRPAPSPVPSGGASPAPSPTSGLRL